ncbi:MAG: hypothetical protein GSR72_04265 [Desulfurococcales archaeon]|nr:hypothetical protein [Desulfurococcales archaeon]
MSARLGWIEKAMMLVPGYRGYKKRELLREDDRLLRRYVADLLRDASNTLRQASSELVQLHGVQAQMMLQQPGNPVQILNWLTQRIYDVAGQIEHLEAGYSPSFDRIKVKEEELERLLEIDNQLIGYSNVISETSKIILGQIRSSRGFDPRYLYTIQQSLDALERIIAERRRFLHGSESLPGGRQETG